MPVLIFVLVLILATQTAQAEAMRGSLFLSTPTQTRALASAAFVGRSSGGMFEPVARAPIGPKRGIGGIQHTAVHTIRNLIQEAESRRAGYDAVQYGARIKPRKRPTEMTINEIYDWIKATPAQPHAIGRYQFIPTTLRRVVAKTGIDPSQRFTPMVQDRLADVLLIEAGFNKFQSGTLGRKAFMNNLAKIWAGLPNSSGRSHYDGYAGNKAAISWARFDAVMQRISPERG